MRLGIYGRKVGMTQVFDSAGALLPVTVLDTSGIYVTQVKTKETDGYTAVQVAFSKKKPQNLSMSEAGHFKKASVPAQHRLKEIRFTDTDDLSQIKVGSALSCGMFEKGDKVDVIGQSRGRGFTGVMKRFNFHGKHATHGTSKYFRHGGSNGANTFPGRVFKNKGMPGHMGDIKVTVSNLQIVDVRPEENIVIVKGNIPGSQNGYVLLRTSKRTKKAKKPQGRSLTAAAPAA